MYIIRLDIISREFNGNNTNLFSIGVLVSDGRPYYCEVTNSPLLRQADLCVLNMFGKYVHIYNEADEQSVCGQLSDAPDRARPKLTIIGSPVNGRADGIDSHRNFIDYYIHISGFGLLTGERHSCEINLITPDGPHHIELRSHRVGGYIRISAHMDGNDYSTSIGDEGVLYEADLAVVCVDNIFVHIYNQNTARERVARKIRERGRPAPELRNEYTHTMMSRPVAERAKQLAAKTRQFAKYYNYGIQSTHENRYPAEAEAVYNGNPNPLQHEVWSTAIEVDTDKRKVIDHENLNGLNSRLPTFEEVFENNHSQEISDAENIEEGGEEIREERDS